MLPRPLEQLLRLNQSSPTFPGELSKLLHGEEYERWVQRIKGDDVAVLVNCLDKVSPCAPFFKQRSSCHRF
jgi:hypothetical protein